MQQTNAIVDKNGQVSTQLAVIPEDTSAGNSPVEVRSNGALAASSSIRIDNVLRFAILTADGSGWGHAAAINRDGTLNIDNAAPPGSPPKSDKSVCACRRAVSNPTCLQMVLCSSTSRLECRTITASGAPMCSSESPSDSRCSGQNRIFARCGCYSGFGGLSVASVSVVFRIVYFRPFGDTNSFVSTMESGFGNPS